MDWVSNRTGSELLVTGSSEEMSEYKIKDILSEFIAMIAVTILENCDKSDWRILQFEIWGDSGRIIAYPVLASGERVVVQIELRLLLELWDNLPDPEDDERLFNDMTRSIESRYCSLLQTASMRNPAKSKLNELRARTKYTAYFQSGNDNTSAGTMTL